LPFVAAGRIGPSQLDALARVLAHPEVSRRTPVVALHHPPHNPRSRLKTMIEGLEDAAVLWTNVRQIPVGMILHGHLHRRVQREDPTHGGRVVSVGATSASLEHHEQAKMAGFNVYEIGDDGSLGTMEAHVLSGGRFEIRAIPDAAHA
jgi:3',5'-cyclic AMP phosphodiesterase CpdA